MAHIAPPHPLWCAIGGIAPAVFLLPVTLLIGPALKVGLVSFAVFGVAGLLGLTLASFHGRWRHSFVLTWMTASLLCLGLCGALPWGLGAVYNMLLFPEAWSWMNAWLPLVFLAPSAVAVQYLLWFGAQFVRKGGNAV